MSNRMKYDSLVGFNRSMQNTNDYLFSIEKNILTITQLQCSHYPLPIILFLTPCLTLFLIPFETFLNLLGIPAFASVVGFLFISHGNKKAKEWLVTMNANERKVYIKHYNLTIDFDDVDCVVFVIPKRHRDDEWDLCQAQLIYRGAQYFLADKHTRHYMYDELDDEVKHFLKNNFKIEFCEKASYRYAQST